jgi:hypothetical protein
MENASGEERKKTGNALDQFLLLSASLFVVVGLTAAFWIADKYHLSHAWIYAIGSGAIFVAAVGWGYRRYFRSWRFSAFFIAWMLLHAAISFLVSIYLGFVYYVPIVIVELWIGYTIAVWQFGPPPDKGPE